MGKGLYTAVIALAALVLTISLIATANYEISVDNAQGYKDGIMKVRMEWLNARDVLDRATSQGIANDIISGCAYSDATTEIQGYYTNILGEMYEGGCSFNWVSITGGPNINVTIDLACNKTIVDDSIDYTERIIFKKNYNITSTSPCTFTVTDIESNIEEYSQ